MGPGGSIDTWHASRDRTHLLSSLPMVMYRCQSNFKVCMHFSEAEEMNDVV